MLIRKMLFFKLKEEGNPPQRAPRTQRKDIFLMPFYLALNQLDNKTFVFFVVVLNYSEKHGF